MAFASFTLFYHKSQPDSIPDLTIGRWGEAVPGVVGNQAIGSSEPYKRLGRPPTMPC